MNPIGEGIFTADLRRQLANDHCNSLAFFSLSLLLWQWISFFRGTSDERRATQPFFGCLVLFCFFGGVAELRTTVTQPCFVSFFFCKYVHPIWLITNSNLGRQFALKAFFPCFLISSCNFVSMSFQMINWTLVILSFCS